MCNSKILLINVGVNFSFYVFSVMYINFLYPLSLEFIPILPWAYFASKFSGFPSFNEFHQVSLNIEYSWSRLAILQRWLEFCWLLSGKKYYRTLCKISKRLDTTWWTNEISWDLSLHRVLNRYFVLHCKNTPETTLDLWLLLKSSWTLWKIQGVIFPMLFEVIYDQKQLFCVYTPQCHCDMSGLYDIWSISQTVW